MKLALVVEKSAGAAPCKFELQVGEKWLRKPL